MAEATKGVEISLKVNTEDARKLDDVIKRLGKSADELTAKFTAMNSAMTGGGIGGMAAPSKAGVAVAGILGGKGGESPLMKQFREIDGFLKNTYLKTLQQVNEAQRGLLIGTSGRAGVPTGNRPLDKDITAPSTKTAAGPAFSAFEVNTVNINAQTVNINTSRVGGASAAGGGTGTPSDVTGGGSVGGMPSGGGINRAKWATDTIQDVLSGVSSIRQAEMEAGFLPLKAQVGKSALQSYARSQYMSGDFTFLSALHGLTTAKDPTQQDTFGTLAKQFGFKSQASDILALNRASAFAGMLGSAFGIGTGGGGGGGTSGGLSMGGGSGGFGMGGGGGGFGGVLRGGAKWMLSQAQQLAGMEQVTEQQNMIRALEEYMQLPVYQNERYFMQQRSQMISTQRELNRTGIGGGRAFDIANILPSAYGIQTGEAMGLAGVASHARTFRDEADYASTLNSLAKMQTTGYGQSAMSGVMGMAAMLDVRGGGFTNERTLLGMFGGGISGSINVQEAAMQQAQQSMVGFGGITSESGLGVYGAMLTGGVVNAQEVSLRAGGLKSFGQISQMPLMQAMTLMRLQKEMPGLSVAQQMTIQRMTPAELLDKEKLANIIDPYGKDPNRVVRAQLLGEKLSGGLFDTAASQVVSKTTALGQALSSGQYSGAGGLGRLVTDISGKKDPTSIGMMREISMSLGQIGDMGTEQARAMAEAFGARGAKVTAPALKEGARQPLVDQEKVTLATQTESLYAGMNTALTTLTGVFANAQSEISNIISQLANNTTTKITGQQVVTTAR